MARALRSADPHHVGYTRVKRGKLERIPQKGSILKERGTFEPKEGSKEAKDILGTDYKNFTKDLHEYFKTKETMSELKAQMETLASKNEETMGKIRPLLTKFENVSKEENKFITEFMSDGFKHKFQSYPRETLPYKDLFEESFKRLTSEYQNEISKLKETLKKVTAMESFKREIQKSDSMSKIADYMKNIIRIKEDMVRNMKKMDATINRVQKALLVFIDKPENRIFNLQKSRVKAHVSKTKTGKLTRVKEYSRTNGKADRKVSKTKTGKLTRVKEYSRTNGKADRKSHERSVSRVILSFINHHKSDSDVRDVQEDLGMTENQKNYGFESKEDFINYLKNNPEKAKQALYRISLIRDF